jgi:methylenetetrahydrofolate reductase (NADPH)
MTACPKAMVHGPCGGVTRNGGCEVDDRRCAFIPAPSDAAAPVRHGSGALNAAARTLLQVLLQRPVVVAGLPSEAVGAEATREVSAILAGHVDAALLGDAPWARVQLPPALRAQLVDSEGLRAWASLNCRDRNRVALEAELLALDHIGVAAVHCVTGDHTVLGDRPDAQPVFDLDAPRLAALAAGRGALVSVAESPAAPPTGLRAQRAALKAAAGAEVCFVNHAPLDVTAEFVAAAGELAPHLRFIVCVPLAVSGAGVERLRAFTGPEAAEPPVGVRLCVAAAEAALAIPGVAGVNVSAAAGPGEELDVAHALADVGSALGAGVGA